MPKMKKSLVVKVSDSGINRLLYTVQLFKPQLIVQWIFV